jgi:serine phosphatase RsbU (regulator of sigma subunit)
MEFAGANNPLWIIRNNELTEIRADRFPIGAYVGDNLQKFTNHEWELQKGDYIYLFSDGYADQFGGPKGKKLMFRQFQKLLIENHKKPLAEQKEILEQAFENWRGSLEQVDDVLVIGIKV